MENTRMLNIFEKLAALRSVMAKHKMDAWVISSSDPHQSEYVADHWTGRAWFSGFSGSAGTLVVLQSDAALWTDGRYFIQAERELEESAITLMREGEESVPTIGKWLFDSLESGSTVGFDGKTMSVAAVRRLQKSFDVKSLSLRSDLDLLDMIWADRPAMPANKVFLHEKKYAGLSREQKFEQVRSVLAKKNVSHLLLSSLDDIAWLFNLRGSDIECNPVFLAYAIVSASSVYLYTNIERVEVDALEELKLSNVEICEYDAIARDVIGFDANGCVHFDPATTSYWLMESIPAGVDVVEGVSPSTVLKSIKNKVEIASMAECHRRDGAAVVRFIHWLDSAVLSEKIDEVAIDVRLEAFRALASEYKGPSFPTIAGYAANGAICHYRAEQSSCLTVKPKGLLLVDSGGQYFDGTTDITRTIACGDMTDEERRDYTLVLKSHIGLARAKFIKGTKGIQLDMLARQPLWSSGLDFSHGTGHGVGYFLNVHEGPQSISSRWQDVPFEPGMLITNEPGIYRAGKHGIRIENIMLVVEDIKTEFGQFYKLQPMTLAPIDIRPLVIEMLNAEEVKWLNEYHASVNKELSPLLDGDELLWLNKVTATV